MPEFRLIETLEDGSIDLHESWQTFGESYKSRDCLPYEVYDNDSGTFVDILLRWPRLSWRIVPDWNWRARERMRLNGGEYIPLPWDLDLIPDHFAHVSTENGNMIAFTEDEKKGQLDRQTRMKPGRYLTRFYPQLDSDTVRTLATQVDKATGVKFAVTADEIERVYLNGPNSCMSHAPSGYDSPFHPVRVYAGFDLQLAYLSAKDIDSPDFRASARALVWPEKKKYGRVYGDSDRLQTALSELDYTSDGWDCLEGARIARKTYNGAFIVPYIDGPLNLSDCGNCLEIDSSGDISGEMTNGLSEEEESGEWCAYYEENRNEESYHIHDLDEYWCQTAVDRYAQYCNGYERYYSNNADFGQLDGQSYSQAWLENNANWCSGTEEWTNEELVTLEDTGDSVSLTYARENCFHDSDSDEWYNEKPEADESSSYCDSPNQLALAV